jgi:hypothetical protein
MPTDLSPSFVHVSHDRATFNPEPTMLLTLLGLSTLALGVSLGARLWVAWTALQRTLPQSNDDFIFF